MKKKRTNIAPSVHARLLNRAEAETRPFNELLQYYAMERFLYRLSRSEHAEHFILKGALMLQLWGGPLTRATKDIDLLGRNSATVGELIGTVRSCLEVAVDDDGLRFDPNDVTGETIRLTAHYDGVRIRCSARLGSARVALQIDVGFGDVITPDAQDIEYPTLLEFDAPRMLGYTPQTAIAEKLEAMVVLDMANSRMKDVLDIWLLAQGRDFDGKILADARPFPPSFGPRGDPANRSGHPDCRSDQATGSVRRPAALRRAFLAATGTKRIRASSADTAGCRACPTAGLRRNRAATTARRWRSRSRSGASPARAIGRTRGCRGASAAA